MGEWEQFTAEVPWFLDPGQVAEVGEAETCTRGTVTSLPALSRLLEAATITPISVDDHGYELLTWGPPEVRRGWLCLPPVPDRVGGIHEVHQEFLSACGGVLERFGEPISW